MKKRILLLSFLIVLSTNLFSNVLHFDGGNDRVEIPNNALLNFGTSTDFTLEAWVKITGPTVWYDGIITKGVGNYYQLVVYDNKLAAEIKGSGTNSLITGTTLLNDGNWHHLAMVLDRSATNIKLFIDGNEEANANNVVYGRDVDDTGSLLIGVDREKNRHLPASIDEVRIWNVARTQSEIQSNMNNVGLSPSTSGLVAYYHFDQGTANGDNTGITTLIDATSNNLNGTLNNFALTGTTSNFTLNDNPLPVELTTFTTKVNIKNIELNWETATEVNNYGFEIERSEKSKVKSEKWKKIGFVNGHGNSNSSKYYSYRDNEVTSGIYKYRLKQIDIDGQFEYSDVVEADLGLPTEFNLAQNYPNPFNPSTVIEYNIPADVKSETSNVKLIVYDALGSKVVTLVNQFQDAGNYKVAFDASNFSNGVYYYTLSAGNFISTKKMILMK